nr:hypothetical protein [Tanacetum cinerariifolium]
DVKIILPKKSQTILDALLGYVGLYTHHFSLSNLRLLIPPFICLKTTWKQSPKRTDIYQQGQGLCEKIPFGLRRGGLRTREECRLSSPPVECNDVKIILPKKSQTILDALLGYVGLYTHHFSLSNLRLPIPPFISPRCLFVAGEGGRVFVGGSGSGGVEQEVGKRRRSHSGFEGEAFEPERSDVKVILPKKSQTILDAPLGYVGMYTHHFSLSTLRLPISPFICKVLNYFNVHISRFNPFGMVKLTNFVVMCKAFGGEPTVDLFWSFLNLGRADDWLTLSNRGSADVPKAIVKPITHLGN